MAVAQDLLDWNTFVGDPPDIVCSGANPPRPRAASWRTIGNRETIYFTVTKMGIGMDLEGDYCKKLGGIVCPSVIHVERGRGPQCFYVSEMLDQAPMDKSLVRRIEDLLARQVWSRHPVTIPGSTYWKNETHRLFGIRVPGWVESGARCLIHGCPTMENTLVRGDEIRICDPYLRPYVPQMMEVDCGRMLQSALWWERILGDPAQKQLEPKWWSSEEIRRRAIFWCGAAAVRIQAREKMSGEPRHAVMAWCERVKLKCSSAAEI